MASKKYDPNIHHRRSIRLPEYDYSQAGAYFITICVQNRQNLFGKIINGKMILNQPGKMIENQWHALQQRFRNIELDSHVIMPNHFHGIIILNNRRRDESCIHPDNESPMHPKGHRTDGFRIHPNNESPFNPKDNRRDESRIHPENKSLLHVKGEYQIRPDNHPKGTIDGSIGRIIQGFKLITTNKYIIGVRQDGWKPFAGKLWQCNYFERVVRNEDALNHIREYIVNNPGKWQGNKNNSGHLK
jgi:putative transposase